MSLIAIVIPCFNEEARLDLEEFSKFLSHSQGIRLIFVDDGSTDGTATMLTRLAELDPQRVEVLRLERNSGKAEAVRRGIQSALASPARYVGFWDADLATPLETIDRFREVLDRQPAVQMVIGSRVQLLGRQIERSPVRHYLGRVFATVVSIALGLRVYDTQCGAKLFRRSPDVEEVFREPFAAGWVFDVEILARLTALARREGRPPLDATIVEYPLEKWRHVAGSKLGPAAYLKAAWSVARIYWTYLRQPAAKSG